MSVNPSPFNSIAENSGELVLELLSNFSNLTLDCKEISTLDKSKNKELVSISKVHSENNINLNKMAPPTFDTKLFNIVPQFDGNPLELSAFLDTANMLINTYWDVTPTNINCSQNVLLIYGIYAKLSGFAKEVYSTCISKDWASVKSALIAHFGDHRDESGLLSDLCSLKQNNNELPLLFLQRVMSNLNALYNYIDTHELDETNKLARKTFYQKHCLNVFLSGLKEPLGSTIRAMRPPDLATARQFIVTENNIKYIHRNSNFNQQNTAKPDFNSYRPQIQNNPQHNNFRMQSQFPSQPINVNPRPVQQKFFTNKQVFGKPPNVWKPKNQNNFPRPTPMSGVSHGTSFARQNKPPTNIFKNHRPNPNIITEELFNIEPVDNEEQHENYYSEDTPEYYLENEYPDYANYCSEGNDVTEQNFQIAETQTVNT